MALYDGIAGSGTTMTAKIRYAPCWIGPFYWLNTLANQSNQYNAYIYGDGVQTVVECMCPAVAGEIAAFQWNFNAAITAGSFTINVMVAGSSAFTTAAQTAQRDELAIAAGSAVCAASDRIGQQFSTTAAFAPSGSIDGSSFLLWVPT